MKELDSVQWGEFKLSMFLQNHHGKRLVERDREQGDRPLLTAGESNNGVSSFITNEEMKYYKDFISIDMFGNAFYHSYKATGDDNIYFFLNDELSPYVKLFFVACINKQKAKFSYGKQFRQQNADNLKIILPVDSDDKPDFDFMENFMKELEQKHLKRALNYYQAKLDKVCGGGAFSQHSYHFAQDKRSFVESGLMEITKHTLSLESTQWGEFAIGEVFDFVMRGKRLIERDRIKGSIPYYSASKENNGLSDMIANPLFIQKNRLIISTFCECYFVEGEFTASDEITIFGNDNLNKYNGLFVASMVKNQAIKYAFGRKAFSERLVKQIIKLPIDSNSQPHWEFMQYFMRELESKHLQKILAYYQHKLH